MIPTSAATCEFAIFHRCRSFEKPLSTHRCRSVLMYQCVHCFQTLYILTETLTCKVRHCIYSERKCFDMLYDCFQSASVTKGTLTLLNENCWFLLCVFLYYITFLAHLAKGRQCELLPSLGIRRPSSVVR
jgi:hypothetical protein